MYVDLNAKFKSIKVNIEKASSELNEIKSIFSSCYTVNDVYIEKTRIKELENKFQQMIHFIDDEILPSLNEIKKNSVNDLFSGGIFGSIGSLLK